MAKTKIDGKTGKHFPLKAAQCLRALAHPTRMMIVHSLRNGAKTVGEIEAIVGTTQSNVSQHLKILRDLGLLKAKRVKNHVWYSVADMRVLKLIDVVREVLCRG
jgi:DNA-binding transcriptional ArsR family regulator